MKILYTTDLHGDKNKYAKLLKATRDLRPDAVIDGGDMLPKQGQDIFRDQAKFIRRFLGESWFGEFQNLGIHYLCQLGNDDLAVFDPLFDEVCGRFPLAHNIAQRKVEIGGYEFVGMNWVVDYPFRLKDRCRMDSRDYVFQRQFGKGLLSAKKEFDNGWETVDDWFAYAKTLPTIKDELNRLPVPGDMGKAVYVVHMPPCCLGLDQCGSGDKVGSRAVYEFLGKNQPLLSLHGHIHESPWMSGSWRAKLGETTCVQPGQGDRLTCVTVDLETMEIELDKL